MRLAQQCAVLLVETMDQLGLPLEIIGFTTRYDRSYVCNMRRGESLSPEEIESQFARFLPTQHLIYKDFREQLRRCRGRFGSMEASNYTPINESVLLAAKRILQQKASRRILIVLTDGLTFLGSTKTQSIALRNLQDNLDLIDKGRGRGHGDRPQGSFNPKAVPAFAGGRGSRPVANPVLSGHQQANLLPQIIGVNIMKIVCLACGWEPAPASRWVCSCGFRFNTFFYTVGVCPKCLKQWEVTQCLRCHWTFPHQMWYRVGENGLFMGRPQVAYFHWKIEAGDDVRISPFTDK